MKPLPAFPLEDYLAHQQPIDEAVGEVLRRGQYVLGGEVAAFEEEFAAFLTVDQVVGVANGTDAIELMLRGLEIGRGDLVVVPSHTAVASASGILRAGAEPVFGEVDAETMTLCPEALEVLLKSPIGGRVRAVLAVHLYGHPCDMERLERLCREWGVILLEDCAQAHGAEYQERKVGSLGRAAAFSFYPTKNLGAVGDGGAVATSDLELAERIRVLRQYGWVGRYVSDFEGINSRLDELQAAMLRVKLRTLVSQLERRRGLAMWYHERLHEWPAVRVPKVKPDCRHAWHLYVVRSAQRDALLDHLTGQGISAAVHYPVPIHQQPGYAAYAEKGPPLPITEQLAREVLSLPLHPYLSEADLERVTRSLGSFAGEAQAERGESARTGGAQHG